jgi:hypothetical protein
MTTTPEVKRYCDNPECGQRLLLDEPTERWNHLQPFDRMTSQRAGCYGNARPKPLEPAPEKCRMCGAWICSKCLSCSSDCGCTYPGVPCECWWKDKQVCDICQGITGLETDVEPAAPLGGEWVLVEGDYGYGQCMTHCCQGQYPDSCKYGRDEKCPRVALKPQPTPEVSAGETIDFDSSYYNGFTDGREHGYHHCGSCSHAWDAHSGECGAYEPDGSICGCKRIITDGPRVEWIGFDPVTPEVPVVPSGIDLIHAERLRQISVEGWTPEHDDGHSRGEMMSAAVDYVAECKRILRDHEPLVDERGLPFGWPWQKLWWKPSPDPIRNLVKAGALIAAEIDRLQRAQKKEAAHAK